MIVKIYRERGNNLTKRVGGGEDERTNPYRGMVGGGARPKRVGGGAGSKRKRNGKNMVRTCTATVPP
jgi:hypothetical protein